MTILAMAIMSIISWIITHPLTIFIMINLVMLMLVILLGGALTLYERKILSIYQLRVGPYYVGEKGRLQFIADAVKVLFKELIYIEKTNKRVLLVLIVLFLGINISYFNIIEIGHITNTLNIEYTPILLYALLSLSHYMVVAVGQLLKNKYTKLASVRAAVMGVSVDLLLALLLAVLVLINGTITYIYVPAGYISIKIIILLPIIFIVLIIILAEIGKPPFDIVEAESEVIMGVHSELSGFLFVTWLLGEYLHIFILSTLLANLIV